jgi:hypothetical protein
MSPILCKKHGMQNMAMTSARFQAAIWEGRSIEKSDVRMLEIRSAEGKRQYPIDAEILTRLQIASVNNTLTLKERDQHLKQLNDRLVIQKIFREMKDNWVCAACLDELADGVEPAKQQNTI